MRLLRRTSLLLMGLIALTVSPRAALPQGTGYSGRLVVTVGGWTKNPVAAGQTTTASLSGTATNPDGGPYCPYSAPTWNWTTVDAPLGVTISQPDHTSATGILQATIPNPGVYRFGVTATATWTNSCGGSISDTATIPCILTVVGVQNLQYRQPIAGGGGSYIDVTKALFVLVGKSVTFKALPNPVGSTFPTGNPIWSGSSGATGTGATNTVTFNTLSTSVVDFKTVTATCGNTSATANVIVLDLLPIATPGDNFVGRDLDAWGVCEDIELSFSTTPTGISASDIGGLEWKITAGGGTLENKLGGNGIYFCPEVPDAVSIVILSLVIKGGPMLGEEKDTAPVRVVAPQDATVLRRPNTDLRHVINRCSVGFCGDYYATCPKAVSFNWIQVREGTCLGTATLWYKDRGFNNLQHPVTGFYSLKTLVKGNGYQWDFDASTRKFDKIYSGDSPAPFGIGSFVWPIPNEYKRKGAADNTATKYATATHSQDSDAAGKCTIRKAGSGDFSKDAGDISITPANWND